MLSSSSLPCGSLPLLETTLGGKPLRHNAAFTQKRLSVTSHPTSHLSKADRALLARLPDGELLFLSFLPSEGGTPVLVLRRGGSLFFFFSRVLRRPLPLPSEELSSAARRLLSQTLTAVLEEKLTSPAEVGAFLAERLYREGRHLFSDAFAAVCSLLGRLLFREELFLYDGASALLDDPSAAFAALGALLTRLARRSFYEEEGPPVALERDGERLFFLYEGTRYAISRLRLPLGVEAVAPYTCRPEEAEIALLFALVFEFFLPL